MKKIAIIIGAVIIAAAIAGSSFYGGMAYQQNQANTIRDRFLRDRGLEGQTPGQGGFPGQGNGQARGFFGGGITGQVKNIEGNTLILSTPQNETRVTLSDTTLIEKTLAGALSDLQPGQQVMVNGQRGSDGNLSAVQVIILPDTSAGQAGSPNTP